MPRVAIDDRHRDIVLARSSTRRACAPRRPRRSARRTRRPARRSVSPSTSNHAQTRDPDVLGSGNGDEDQIGRGALGAYPDPARAAAHQRFRQDPVVRRHDRPHRDRMRHHRLGRGQGAGRRHGAEPGADHADQRGIRPAAQGRGPARHHPAVGDALQRHPRPLRAARGPGIPGARPARHHHLGDQRRRLRAVGHSRQVARRAGVAAARRTALGADAGLRLGRLGTGPTRSATSSPVM